MLDAEAALRKFAESSLPRPIEPTLTMTSDGLVLGSVVLAKMGRGPAGKPELLLDGQEQRILALLAVVYGEAIGPPILETIRRASDYWTQGEPVLAAIALARAGLPPLDDPERVSRGLSHAEQLLDNGCSPHELTKICDLDTGLLDLRKAGYNPDESRIPAGSPDGGQWTDDGAGSGAADYGPPTIRPSTSAGPIEGDYGSSTPPGGEPSSAAGTIHGGGEASGISTAPPGGEPPASAGIIFANYRVIKEPPSDARVVVPPDGTPILNGDPSQLLIAPPHADYREIYGAGQAIAEFPPWKQYGYVRAAIGQEGRYDFQRDVANQNFYQAYTPAANYAVGFYMAGAGYTLDTTLALAKLYALRNSSNYGTQDQLGWIKRGWRDAKSGRWQ